MARNEDWPVAGRPCNDPLMHRIKGLQGNAARQHDIGDIEHHSGGRIVRIGASDAKIGTPREVGKSTVGTDTQVKLPGRRYHVPGGR